MIVPRANESAQSALERATQKEGERQTRIASYVVPARERNGEGARITRTGCRGGYLRRDGEGVDEASAWEGNWSKETTERKRSEGTGTEDSSDFAVNL